MESGVLACACVCDLKTEWIRKNCGRGGKRGDGNRKDRFDDGGAKEEQGA